MATLTANQIEKTKRALTETENLLAKELKYSSDLQNVKMVEFYKSHINNLNNMING